jgi:hypothetical protein
LYLVQRKLDRRPEVLQRPAEAEAKYTSAKVDDSTGPRPHELGQRDVPVSLAYASDEF